MMYLKFSKDCGEKQTNKKMQSQDIQQIQQAFS